MRHEGDVPEGVTKVVEGVPYCPNHEGGIPMRPVASVDVTERPKASPGLGEGLSLAERLDAIRVAEQDVEAREREWDDSKKHTAKKKQAFEESVDYLREVIESMTSFGRPVERPPLLEEMENPKCICGHRQDEHEAEHGCLHNEGDVTDVCSCEIFEVEEQTAVLTPEAVDAITAIAAQQQEELRQRLAQLQIVVEVADIEAWSLEDYDAVVAYVTALETTPENTPARPDVLPVDVPEHITALHRSLAQHGVVVGLGAICAWSLEQRTQAGEWAAKESDAVGSSERPEHVPAPAAEPQLKTRRRREKQAVGA